uniref:Phosphorylase b kinase regulatory subunit n=1 Tax=Anopheles coluzzii TaxID=1518534 RepID=A0A8W7PSJ6_ANOCL
MLEEGRVVTVRGLLKGLYEKACQQKMWGLVRHTAGMLGKRVEDLAKAVTDLLVRQKQVTVGMPPNSEHTITAPLPEMELRAVIHEAYGDDESTAMLSQELLVYLAMFIRTEPQLFHEMLRLRVGLIIQVMAKELSRTLNCDGEQASEHLLNLSPFEMKNLLHHILSGKEFAINSVARGNISIVSCKSSRVSKKSQIGIGEPEAAEGSLIDDRQGQWLRRRRLDGALNRVPRDFYPRVWTVLERCSGLAIEGRILPQSLTQEMTPNELKFALEVETALNTIPQPEYRQLVVEALMVLTLVTEHNILASIGTIIYVEHLVHRANQLFLEDQRKSHGDAMLCCAKNKDVRETTTAGLLLCGGAAYICQHLYDSAPSGSYGTMTYMARAVASVLELPKHGDMDCTISCVSPVRQAGLELVQQVDRRCDRPHVPVQLGQIGAQRCPYLVPVVARLQRAQMLQHDPDRILARLVDAATALDLGRQQHLQQTGDEVAGAVAYQAAVPRALEDVRQSQVGHRWNVRTDPLVPGER